MNSTKRKTMSKETTIFTRAFGVAAIGFILISLIGLIVWLTVDATGLLRGIGDKKFDWSMYKNMQGSDKMAVLGKVSIAAMGLIMVSFVLRIIWAFRFRTAGKFFIYSVFTIYIIAQGLGFGIMFTLWRAQDLLIIFGVAGVMFATMSFAGYKARDLSRMGVYLFYAMIGLMVLSGISMILYFSGVYDSTLIFIIVLGSGVLTLLYTMYDVWLLKKFSQNEELQYDEEMKFRIVMFFGFRLLTDIVQMIWTVARLMRFFRN